MRNKKGISLIVLVITVIIMIILAGAIVITLSDMKILKKSQGAVDTANEQEVQQLVSVLWSEAYMAGYRTPEEIRAYIIEGLAENELSPSDYAVAVNMKGAEVSVRPVKYRNEYIDTVVDGVPIPKGFVASTATGENTKNGGLVIYETSDAVTNANVETAKREYNQYVWVPVDDFSDFKRGVYDNTTYSNVLGADYWEVKLDTATNIPLPEQVSTYMTDATLAEVQAMYQSVQKYGGFYIARYETGIDAQRTSSSESLVNTVYSMMGKVPYNYIQWGASAPNNGLDESGGAVQTARNVYTKANTKYGVVSTLTYGVQWDATLQWYIDTGAMTSNNVESNSSDFGNYSSHVIGIGDLNAGARYTTSGTELYQEVEYDASGNSTSTKDSGTWILTTGALKDAKINNIYDMAGNMAEWTMEGYQTKGYIVRGGNASNGTAFPISERILTSKNGTVGASWAKGFRVALYLK